MKEIEDAEAVAAVAQEAILLRAHLKKAEKEYKESIAATEKLLAEADKTLLEYLTEHGITSVDAAPFPHIPNQLWAIERRSSKVRFYSPEAVYRAMGTEGFQMMRVSAPAVDELHGKLDEDKWAAIHEGYTEKESEPWIALTLKRTQRSRG